MVGVSEAPRRRGEAAAWIALFLWALLIFATVPFVRVIQRAIATRFGSVVFGYAVLGTIIVVVIAVSILLLRRGEHRPSRGALLWLAAIAGVFVWWTVRLWGQPEEAVHFLEYGVLGVLAFRALRHRVADSGVFVAAALVGTMIGTADEIIQWVTPERFWDLRDIVINGGSSALIQLALWKALPPRPLPLRPGTLRLACRLAAAEVVLLALCLANTPARVEWYADRIPLLGFLAANPNAMSEYGYSHHDPAIGTFRSRFTVAELGELDRVRGHEVGGILTRYPHDRYGEFLRTYTPGRDPFAHEARVHMFSRNRHLSEARKHPQDSEVFREHCTIALRENQILETYFGRTLTASKFALSKRQRTRLERHHLPDRPFESRVSAHLVTRLSEWQVQSLNLVAVLCLLGLDRWLARSGGTQP